MCTRCKLAKPAEEFAWRSKKAGTRLAQCKACRVEVTKAAYVATPRPARFRGSGDAEEQRCGKCKQWKLLADFHWANRDRGERQRTCASCANATTKSYNDRNSEARRDTWRRYRRKAYMLQKYGLTIEQYWTLYELQHERCAICGVHGDDAGQHTVQQLPLHVDHDHVTGEVRGLLCRGCNMGLGSFRDDVAVMRAAIAYLER